MERNLGVVAKVSWREKERILEVILSYKGDSRFAVQRFVFKGGFSIICDPVNLDMRLLVEGENENSLVPKPGIILFATDGILEFEGRGVLLMDKWERLNIIH